VADREGVDRDVCTTFGRADRAISEIAASQRALITRAQLTELGVGRRAIDHAMARGRLHRVHRGIYSLVPFPALPPLAREHAAVLACGDRALLGRHSAAGVWGIRPFLEGAVDVVVVGKETGRRRPGIRVHRAATLRRADARRHQRLPITSPARTLLDIAPELSDRSLERAFDEALIQRLVTHATVNAVLAAYPHSPAVGRFRQLADPGRPTTATRSGGEEAFLTLARKAQLPAPEVNAHLGRFVADFLWRPEKIVLELDGYDYHRGRAAFERDHQRDAEHQHQDFLVIRTTASQLKRQPEALLVHLATALERRRAAA
jgi:very-short-patch-repair endonuclease